MPAPLSSPESTRHNPVPGITGQSLPVWVSRFGQITRLADDCLSHRKCPNAKAPTPSDRQCYSMADRTTTVRTVSNEKRVISALVCSVATSLDYWPVLVHKALRHWRQQSQSQAESGNPGFALLQQIAD
jgi:hypothetical protein